MKCTLFASLAVLCVLNTVSQDTRDGRNRKDRPVISDPPWQITAPRQNEVVSGLLDVYVRDAAPNQPGRAILLYVDGHKQPVDGFGSADDLPPLDGVGVYVAHVFTPAFANGYHTLSAKDDEGNGRTRRVFFDNFVHELDWDGFFTADEQLAKQKDLPLGFHLKAKLKRECPWRVRIAYPSGRQVYVTEGRSSRIDLSWDGATTRRDATTYEHLVCKIEIKEHPSRNLEVDTTKVRPK